MSVNDEAGQRLMAILQSYGSTVVAFSGGVDSTLLAAAAHRALGDRALAVVSDSPTLPRSELAEARAQADQIGIRFHPLERSELDDPRFTANPTNRCFFCKDGLTQALTEFAAGHGFATVALGVNASDVGDWRPGIEAARSRGARFPLLDAGLDKDAVRALAHSWGLRAWDKPAAPCLSSRIPYGQPVTLEKLARIEAAEEFVRARGFRDVRVRHFDGLARIEVPATDVARLQSLEPALGDGLRRLGFPKVVLDERGLKSGRLNEEAGTIPANP